MHAVLDCAGRPLDLREPRVMGVLNVTPDSFSDGGNFFSVPEALARARTMVAEGAAVIDVGGESTRPGARPVTAQEELDRVAPVIEAIRSELDVPISIDTSKPEVMRQAVAAGAGMINDVWALRLPGAIEIAAALNVPVCLMHMQAEPGTMQQQPHYEDVVAEVKQFLVSRIDICTAAGIPRQRLLLDPGFGFGKNLQHNLRLLQRLSEFRGFGLPLLVGLSRKSMLGTLLQVPAEERVYGSVAAATIAAWQGAAVIRAHDVQATVHALKVCHAVAQADEK